MQGLVSLLLLHRLPEEALECGAQAQVCQGAEPERSVAADLLRHGGAGKISLAAGMRDLLARSNLADDELAEQA